VLVADIADTLVDEMHLHGGALAVDRVLARPMEVELLEPVDVLARPQRAAIGEAELDAMAVVDDRVGAPRPVEVGPRPGGAPGPRDVDRRLLGAGRADVAVAAERAPLVGTGRALVAPVRRFLREARGCTQRAGRERGHRLQQVTTVHGVSPDFGCGS